MLRIGVLGAGHLGKIHLKCIKMIESFELVGFYDTDKNTAEQVEQEFYVTRYETIDELINDVDVIDIVTPTISHFDNAANALRKSKHVFIEKPVVASPKEAEDLIKLADEANVKVQVGHVERFNPAFISAFPQLDKPMFIEAHRLAEFNPRGTDVPVVLDLMIHDIDIVLSVIKSPVKKVSASGIPVVSDTPDIANARLEFANGGVANLTASRISLKNMRKVRFFQRDAYVSVDFLKKAVEVVRMEDLKGMEPGPLDMVFDLGEGKGSKKILIDRPEVQPINAIQTELESFAVAINTNTAPPVTIEDGYNALNIAYQIIDKFKFPVDKGID
ncbi:MAG: Gfo/Idh/MocA family oxidoreductase [Bacteroidales bacterium]|nr:Gfo/Idh/MocA family oxidoreductase [Bacteroidales bacterium]